MGNDDSSLILTALLVVGMCGFLYWLWRSMSSGAKTPGASRKAGASGSGGSAASASIRTDDPEKQAALEKFREVHSRVRDVRAKMNQEIQDDPQRATRAIRNLMNRE